MNKRFLYFDNSTISSLLVAYPEYTEEFNFAIAEINNFLSYESTL